MDGWTLLLAVGYFIYGAIFAADYVQTSSRPWLVRYALGLVLLFLWPLGVMLLGLVIAGAVGRIVGAYFSSF